MLLTARMKAELRRVLTVTNKYIFHTQPNTLFSNICNTFSDKIFIDFCIKNVICPHVQNSNICFDLFMFSIGWM